MTARREALKLWGTEHAEGVIGSLDRGMQKNYTNVYQPHIFYTGNSAPKVKDALLKYIESCGWRLADWTVRQSDGETQWRPVFRR